MAQIKKTPLALAVGAALSVSLTANVANAEQNPFSMSDLSSGYMVASSHDAGEGKCGEGKCGGDKKAEEGKCGEGKCGGDKKAEEGKCGEGKCGGDKNADDADKAE